MKRKLIGTLFVAAASGALVAGPMVGSALADVPGWAHRQPPGPGGPGPDWGGFDRPGWADPADPFRNDWHCDRHGRWHDDEHDGWGHDDGRCRAW
ncbi:hypothetical protein [Nocardia aurantia]|uniref:hypothetical protein n=1 Tax=Nocardia aurantia TaxID=2585199 RepID=UPI0029E81E30|nr:hypothetical protein [Nocardia aurantia]